MKNASYALLTIALGIGALRPLRAGTPETPHLTFVTEYIRELATNEKLRASAEEEISQAKNDNESLRNAIHGSTRIQLELQSQIDTLKDMRLNKPFETVIPAIMAFYHQKIELSQKMIDGSGAFLAGPKPGVDLGALVADMPKVRAKMEFIDETLFKDTTPLTYATLIDMRPDSQDHCSHLIITKAERTKIIGELNDYFKTIDEKDQDYNVTAAHLFKTLLLERKCSDEPWE
jgi:hypothetical protein